jgi:hypothetical protein
MPIAAEAVPANIISKAKPNSRQAAFEETQLHTKAGTIARLSQRDALIPYESEFPVWTTCL